jgi:hypothetical protein
MVILHLNIIFQITNLLRLKLEFRIDFILGFSAKTKSPPEILTVKKKKNNFVVLDCNFKSNFHFEF